MQQQKAVIKSTLFYTQSWGGTGSIVVFLPSPLSKKSAGDRRGEKIFEFFVLKNLILLLLLRNFSDLTVLRQFSIPPLRKFEKFLVIFCMLKMRENL